MSDLADLVVNNYNEQRSQYNGRKSTITRIYGQEHSAGFSNGSATLFFPVDTDMVYISELGIKLLIGDYNTEGPSAGGAIISPVPAGHNTYPTFDSWVEAFPVGAKIDMDGSYGYQCWDYADAFWVSQTGRTLLTGNHYVSNSWKINRVANAGTEFDLITSLSQVKKGDWIVKDGQPGHIAMAANDYHGGNILNCYGQNQGQGGAISIVPLSMGNFLGAFRYKNWN